MSVESVSVNKTIQSVTSQLIDAGNRTSIKSSASNPVIDAETKQMFDEASGLLQAIVSDKLTDKVLRKIPSDEYLNLLSLLDDIVSGSVDQRV